MSKVNDGGHAFPRQPVLITRPGKQVSEYVNGQTGMTLRDWFAGQALTALIAVYSDGGDTAEYDLARWAYAQADAMLKERERTTHS